ncbi:MAG: TetR/AcrR family transcriptional regulator [Nocardioidaceae bacterium]
MPVAKGTALDPAETRAGIVRSATALLYQRGLAGIGVAELCATMGISKETLYRHFGSKNGLIHAVLTARSDHVVRWLDDAVKEAGDDPDDQVTAVFDALGRWHAERSFRGCAIVNAATQQYDAETRALAGRHLARHRALLTRIAHDAGVRDEIRVGKQLLALLEGSTVLASLGGDTDAARVAKDAALALIHASR